MVAVNQALVDQHPIQEEVSIYQADFFNHCSRQLMTVSELTAHQKEKLEELDVHLDEDIHVRAPAGAGKTFVALCYVLEKLKLSGSSWGKILYICPGRALVFHFLQWLLIHPEHALPDVSRKELLQRVVVMHHPYDKFMSVDIQDSRIVLDELKTAPKELLLAVFDESHDIFRTASSVVQKVHAHQKILLSDVSQSSMVQTEYPEMREVTLTEAVGSRQGNWLRVGTPSHQGFGPQPGRLRCRV